MTEQEQPPAGRLLEKSRAAVRALIGKGDLFERLERALLVLDAGAGRVPPDLQSAYDELREAATREGPDEPDGAVRHTIKAMGEDEALEIAVTVVDFACLVERYEAARSVQ